MLKNLSFCRRIDTVISGCKITLGLVEVAREIDEDRTTNKFHSRTRSDHLRWLLFAVRIKLFQFVLSIIQLIDFGMSGDGV